jgi:hypothetical protein
VPKGESPLPHPLPHTISFKHFSKLCKDASIILSTVINGDAVITNKKLKNLTFYNIQI